MTGETDLVRRRLVIGRIDLQAERRVADGTRRQIGQRVGDFARLGGRRRVRIVAAQAVCAGVVGVQCNDRELSRAAG
jgi:hypothetical protein